MVGSGHNAHIAIDRAHGAQALYHLVLQHTQEFGLQLQRHFAYFVQEKGAAIGLFKLARLGFGGAGKGAFFVAKQGGLQQVVWNGRTVNGHIGLAAAVRQLVNLFGKHIFAHTRFAG